MRVGFPGVTVSSVLILAEAAEKEMTWVWPSTRNYHDERSSKATARKWARERYSSKSQSLTGWWRLLYLIPFLVGLLILLGVLGSLFIDKLLGYRVFGLSGGVALLAILLLFQRSVSTFVSAYAENVADRRSAARAGLLLDSVQALASESEIAHVGAIYSIESLARLDSEFEEQMLRLVCDFLKHTTPRSENEDASISLERRRTSGTDIKEVPVKRVRLGVQAALSLVGRFSNLPISREHLDMSYLDLHSVDLIGAHLRGIVMAHTRLDSAAMRESNLEWINLSFASLKYTSLPESTFRHVRFESAQLQEVYFWHATVQECIFHSADLTDANFYGADLEKSSFVGAKMLRAGLGGAKLTAATLASADLRHAELYSADLQRANLRNARLDHANLTAADFRMADLSGTSFEGANLERANLSGVDLRFSKGLTPEQIAVAQTEGTLLPEALKCGK